MYVEHLRDGNLVLDVHAHFSFAGVVLNLPPPNHVEGVADVPVALGRQLLDPARQLPNLWVLQSALGLDALALFAGLPFLARLKQHPA